MRTRKKGLAELGFWQPWSGNEGIVWVNEKGFCETNFTERFQVGLCKNLTDLSFHNALFVFLTGERAVWNERPLIFWHSPYSNTIASTYDLYSVFAPLYGGLADLNKDLWIQNYRNKVIHRYPSLYLPYSPSFPLISPAILFPLLIDRSRRFISSSNESGVSLLRLFNYFKKKGTRCIQETPLL